MCVAVLAGTILAARISPQQKANKVEQGEARLILRQVEATIEKNYYDPTFHGFDLQARFKQADQKLEQARDLSAGLGIIGWAVEGLNDSHTHFIPPMRNVAVYSGWQMQAVQDDCYISAVEPSSDAWKQGLRPGDQILQLESYQPTRESLPAINYRLNILYPLAEYQMVVASPGKVARKVTTKSEMVTFAQTTNSFTGGDSRHQLDRIREGYRLLSKGRTVELTDKLMIWKLPQFDLTQAEVGRLVGVARKHQNLILDLRDNSGGGEEQLKWMISNFFDHDVTVGEFVERTKSAPLRISSRQDATFKGRLLILVNGSSASASEIFARTAQLEKRGTVIGDTTEGAVGRGQVFPLSQGQSIIIAYGAQVTIARLRLADGSDLEGKGVTPDVMSLPTPVEMAEGRDPVLAVAAHLAGVEMTAEEAGKLFPAVWATH